MTNNVRAEAASVLARLEQESNTLDKLLVPARERVPTRDQGLLQELCFGVCRWHLSLAPEVDNALNKPLRARDRDIYWLLLVGLYQIRHSRIPDHAAVSESVAATRSLKKNWASGMVNGVLRRLSRAGAPELADDQGLAHPGWLLQQLQADWPGSWAQMASANNERPPMTLRVNKRFGSRDQYLASLTDAGIAGVLCPLSEDGVLLSEPVAVDKLPDFAAGAVSVQDEGAQLAAVALGPQAGDRILDACAAPGGKTCHLLENQPDLSQLVALDQDSDRLSRVSENLCRLNLEASLCCGDARTPEAWWDGQPFDRILADVPCSATGVIRRHPDIKLHRKPDQIGSLTNIQLSILISLWPLLKPGGTMLYATCSVLKSENDQVVARFLDHCEDAESRHLLVDWGAETEHGRQLLPGQFNTDGFYYALLCKH